MSCCSSSSLMDSTSDRRLTGDQLRLGSDLRLGLTISPSSPSSSSASSSTSCDQDYKRPAAATKSGSWTPIKGVLRSAFGENCGRRATLYVKVYLEGVPIGRKVDVLAQESYGDLATELSRMFGTHILLGRRPENVSKPNNDHHHLLTYEDREGDWMMVGDVPWRMFLGSVKRLKIVRADSCL